MTVAAAFAPAWRRTLVSASLGKVVAAGAAPQLAEGREAFVAGLGDVFLAGSVLAAVAAVVAYLFIRASDLHASAVGKPRPAPPVEAARAASAGAARS